jgi:hypothetical protein
VHPPKIVTFDVPARVNTDTKGIQRPVDEYRETPFGLYMSRAMINRPTAHWVETWLLPDLGLRSEWPEDADCVVIVTAHPDLDVERLVRESPLVVDFRGVTRGIEAPNLVRL